VFVNYFASESRESPINLAASRVLLGIYFLWRSASMDVRALITWPVNMYTSTSYLYPPEDLEFLLVFEKWILVVVAISFIIGYRIRLSAFVAGLLMAHLTGVTMLITGTVVEQLLTGSILILLFGLYAERDRLSVDELRRTRDSSVRELNEALDGQVRESYGMEPLKWSLVAIGILYFGAGWGKIVNGPLLAWTSPQSLARWIVHFNTLFYADLPLGNLLLDNPLLLSLSTWGTVVAEVSFVGVILLGLPVTPLVLVLLGMHAIIVATMGIVFFDMFFFLALFAAFDKGYARLVPERRIELVYDETCFVCAQSLYIFNLLDVNETVTFHSQSDVPGALRSNDDVASDDIVCIFVDEKVRCGYDAFRELFRQFWVTVPLAWIMALSPWKG
jgi:uncharacterized membrane protein YphA (DoxX/SURF4 family)